MGPLQSLRVVELAGIGPAPMAAMLLADLGADVVRIARPGGNSIGIDFDVSGSLLNRGKQSVELDLKSRGDVALVMDLVGGADVLIEGFRPGVAERLGLGPAECHERNPRLVYGRVTGWGRDGPLADVAGHDLNYIALSGALAAMGPRDGKPAIPLNLLGDFGGGSMYLVFGIMAALFERVSSGRGQVVDASMIDGVASLTTTFFGQLASGFLKLQRESNLVDGGAPFYDVYSTADGKWISIGAIEPKFFRTLIELLNLDRSFIAGQHDRSRWPALRDELERCFAARTRDQWDQLLAHQDVCYAPVLTLDEAPRHAHHAAHGTYVNVAGIVQPAASPRFDRTPAGRLRSVAPPVPADTVRKRWGAPKDAQRSIGATGS